MRAAAGLENALYLACLGVAAEVAFTAAAAPSGGWRLIGSSYLWMFPIYALLQPAFSVLRPRTASWPWPARAALYAAILMAVELSTGLVLRAALGEAPWEPGYRGHRWCLLGLVRLDYFPAWAAASLFFERAYLRLNGERPAREAVAATGRGGGGGGRSSVPLRP